MPPWRSITVAQRSSCACSDSGSSRARDRRDEDADEPAPRLAAAGAAGAGARRRPGRRVELGRLVEHLLLQPPQLLARLEPQLVGEEAARVAVDRQRVGLAPRAVEREHELRAQALAQRVRRHQLLQLGDQLGVAAVREVGLDPPLEHGEPPLPEPLDLGGRRALELDAVQRLAAPQRQRVAVALLGGQALEQRGVEVLGRQHVPVRPRGDRVGAEDPPQAGDVALDPLGRGRRRVLAPQLGHQPRRRHDLARVQEQHGQQRLLLGGAQLEGPAVLRDLERTEDPKFHHVIAPFSATVPAPG